MLTNNQVDPARRARLRWQGRRGLLENDLILTRFLDRHEAGLTEHEVGAFFRLMELADNDLMSLLLGRSELGAELDTPHIHALLERLRSA